jgi:hypothetical protein
LDSTLAAIPSLCSDAIAFVVGHARVMDRGEEVGAP